jgi:RNA polymerase sigma factor (TIGR02999 family)
MLKINLQRAAVVLLRHVNRSNSRSPERILSISTDARRPLAPSMNEVTQILSAAEQGDPGAAEQLLPLVYHELRKLAAHKLAREKAGQTIEATALVHDAYLRLVGGGDDQRFSHRGHFFAAAAEAMRRILVENARRKRSTKHGGGLVRRDLDHIQLAAPQIGGDLEALDEALSRLAKKDPIKADLVKLRHFAGLTIEEAAQSLGISMTTANRYWAYARAWLHQEIISDNPAAQNGPLPPKN